MWVVSAQQRFARAVDGSIQQYLDERERALTEISGDAAPVLRLVREMVSGGKRVRSAFVLWGWHAVTASRDGADRTTGTEQDPQLSLIHISEPTRPY